MDNLVIDPQTVLDATVRTLRGLDVPVAPPVLWHLKRKHVAVVGAALAARLRNGRVIARDRAIARRGGEGRQTIGLVLVVASALTRVVLRHGDLAGLDIHGVHRIAELKLGILAQVELLALLERVAQLNAHRNVGDIPNLAVGTQGRSGHRKAVAALHELDAVAVAVDVKDRVDVLAVNVGSRHAHRKLGGTGIGIPLHAGRRDAHRMFRVLDGFFFLLLFDALELGLLRTVHAKVVTGTAARQDSRQHADGDQCSLLTVLLGALRTRCARVHVIGARHVDRRHIGRQVAGARYRSRLSIALL